jgi:hypothetical protein
MTGESASLEAWVTDEDLHSAYERFAAQVPGFVLPEAFGLASKGPSGLTFGHVNPPGAVRRLPAVVLASVCGYAATTGVFRLDREQFAHVIERLTPAEAARHMPHPNLWSWRRLLVKASSADFFLAFFIAAVDDPPVDQNDIQFRQQVGI